VLKFWDTESDEMDIIDLEDAVKELRNKSDVKLNEISIPFSEYQTLKNLETKYPELKEDFDSLKNNYQELEGQNKELKGAAEQLTKEVTHLKEHPIVQEKVVYKENKKELDELKAECERLRLKMFNYETGRMMVPTHGINVGNLYKVRILGVGKDGDGFTKVNNFIIFVPNTTKDQEVVVKITRVLKKYAFGKVSEGEPDGVVLDATTGATAGSENDELGAEPEKSMENSGEPVSEEMAETMAKKEN
jgi:predicted RNA-binding protein with TRAM domain